MSQNETKKGGVIFVPLGGMTLNIFLIISMLVYLPVSVYAVNKCETLFASSVSSNSIPIIPSLGGEVSSDAMIENLTANRDRDGHTRKYYEIYQKRLSGRAPFSDPEKIDFVKEYQMSILKDILDPVQLARMRNEALDAELDNRGAPSMEGILAKDRLRTISQQNFNRIWQEHGLSLSYKKNPEVMQIIEKLEFRLLRNTRDPRIQGDGIFSSRQLEKLTGLGGLNSTNSFNKDFLKSDNNIYFFIKLVEEGRDEQDFSEYGKHGLTVPANSENLPPEAWVSTFIMNPYQLEGIASYLKEVTDRFPEFDPNMKETSPSHDRVLSEVRKIALKRLYRYDFTLSDIKSLIEAKLGQMLSPTLTESAQVRWQNLKSRNTHVTIMKKIVSELRLGYYGDMELKIPVFLPKAVVDKQW